jgi:hypothetical protein
LSGHKNERAAGHAQASAAQLAAFRVPGYSKFSIFAAKQGMERFMFRVLMAMGLAAGLFALAPSVKSYAQDKKSTCEFGANDQKLTGAERKKFMSRCMARDDAPKKKAKPKPKPKQEEQKS